MSKNRYNTRMRKWNSKLNDRGMVSFLVTMIMMLVITLIVIGFSQVVRRSEREALDRQLSTQAFYAAESGVNVTSNAIANYIQTNGTAGLQTKSTCKNGASATDYSASAAGGQGAAIADLNTGSGVRYTCVLVDPNPTSLEYGVVNTNSSTVVPINAAGPLKELTFTWTKQAGDVGALCNGALSDFNVNSAWNCAYGVIRIDLVEDPASNVSNLPAHTVTLFLTPKGTHSGQLAAGTVTFGAAQSAFIASGCNMSTPATSTTCADANTCNTTCSVAVFLPTVASNYYARISSVYRNPQKLTVYGQLSDGSAAKFSGGQALVDVTGQAQDELRRVQTRVSLSGSASDIPSFALSSSSGICKDFAIVPTGTLDLTTVGPDSGGKCN